MAVVGLTTGELPDAITVPPQAPLYQNQFAPVPSEPPETLRVAEAPAQIVEALIPAEVGSVERVFTVTTTLKQEVVLHVPAALTQYSVVKDGVIPSEIPLANAVPPHEPEYQSHFPPVPSEPPEIPKTDEFPLHITAGVAEIDVANTDNGFTTSGTLPQLE